jgi:hypothetical protein
LNIVETYCNTSVLPEWAPQLCATWKRVLDLLENNDEGLASSLDWALKRRLFTEHIARHGMTWDGLGAWSKALDGFAIAADAELDDPLRIDESLIESWRGERGKAGAAVAAASKVLAAHGLEWSGLARMNALRDELCELDMRFGELGRGVFAELERGTFLKHRVTRDADLIYAADHPPSATRAHARGKWIARLQPNSAEYKCGWDCIVNSRQRLDLSDPLSADAKWLDLGSEAPTARA